MALENLKNLDLINLGKVEECKNEKERNSNILESEIV